MFIYVNPNSRLRPCEILHRIFKFCPEGSSSCPCEDGEAAVSATLNNIFQHSTINDEILEKFIGKKPETVSSVVREKETV